MNLSARTGHTSRRWQERPHVGAILVRTDNHHALLLLLVLLIILALVCAMCLDRDSRDDTVLAPRVRVFLDGDARIRRSVFPDLGEEPCLTLFTRVGTIVPSSEAAELHEIGLHRVSGKLGEKVGCRVCVGRGVYRGARVGCING